MKRKHFGAFIVGIFALATLTGCNEADAFVTDKTEMSIYGKLGDFYAPKWKAGQVLTFTATPDEMYTVGDVLHNNNKLQPIARNADGSQVFQTVLTGGENTLVGKYKIRTNIDVVEKYKITEVIGGDVFNTVLSSTATSDITGIDFRRGGVEKMRAPNKFDSKGVKVKDTKAFINYVDGDTTHIETFNLGYTIKIRYLGINTPESTSEIEEWGLTASNYNKFLYSGDESYLTGIDDAEQLKERLHGATTVILVSQAATKQETVADSLDQEVEHRQITVPDLKVGQDLEVNGPFHATTDGYQRNLAYVWYATVQNPTANDFRCLNLEMVYQGLSLGIGSSGDTSAYTYRFFSAANNSAQANRRHIYSLYEDSNYYYYEQYDEGDPATWKWQVQDLSLTALFNSCQVKDDPRIKYDPSTSPYADKKTLYRIGGYVSAKVGQSFYIQEHYQYDNDDVINGVVEPHGIYVFTLRQMPIRLGDYVQVIGAVSTYGGTFQMQGVSYSPEPNLNRDTVINPVGYSKHTVVPVQVTGAQFNRLKLHGVLVEIIDNLYFYDFYTKYNGENESISEGGDEEVNKYNDTDVYKFYNTNNTPIFYASYTASNVYEDNAAAINEAHIDDVQSKGDPTIRYTDDVIRFTLNDGVRVTSGIEECHSYKFFTGGSYLYNPYGARFANNDDTNPHKDATVQKPAKDTEFVRKAHMPAYAGHGLILISRAYESTGGNRKMTGEICSGSPSQIKLCSVNWRPDPGE